jgi:chromate transporter
LRIGSGRQPAEPLLRSFVVVLTTPGINDDLGVREAREPVLVQALVAEAAIERFDVRVLRRLARLDQQ